MRAQLLLALTLLAGFVLVWRGVQDYACVPLVMGRGIEIRPALAILGVLAGGELAGVAGMFHRRPRRRAHTSSAGVASRLLPLPSRLHMRLDGLRARLRKLLLRRLGVTRRGAGGFLASGGPRGRVTAGLFLLR